MDDLFHVTTILLLLAVLIKPLRIGRKLERILEFMATQEERLKAISTKIDEVLAMLANLKSNNPEIEDEISEIEAKLSGAQPAPEG